MKTTVGVEWTDRVHPTRSIPCKWKKNQIKGIHPETFLSNIKVREVFESQFILQILISRHINYTGGNVSREDFPITERVLNNLVKYIKTYGRDCNSTVDKDKLNREPKSRTEIQIP